MLKPQDLRVGNWYTSTKWQRPVMCQLSDIAEIHHRLDGAEERYAEVDEMFQPIPLTEEYLLKAGFVKVDHDVRNDIPKFMDGRCQFVVWIYKTHSVVSSYDESDGTEWYLAAIFYLHELQDIIHSLTGEELTINL